MVAMLYLLFFLSGAAALVYQVAWVRSLGLIFGASHLAVTTVLSVFMGGLALGSALFGRRADESSRPLRLYGLLEIGVAASALGFLGLMKVYPAIYVPLARLGDEHRLWLSTIRVAFAVAAMIVPTTLMGGTLPVLSRFVAGRSETLGRHLSFLYGFNTLGAVAGSLATGFALLRAFGVARTLLIAVATNLAVGLIALLLRESSIVSRPDRRRHGAAGGPVPDASHPAGGSGAVRTDLPLGLVLWGIGVSGFCALGYEVLWTRMLSVVVGTSVYSFTIMLVAFLAGIALGSQALGLLERRRTSPWTARGLVVGFGAVQIAIGVAAFAVTVLMRDLPSHATGIQAWLLGHFGAEFFARQGASFVVAFAYMFVPAFFMGVAFPLAGTIHATRRERVGGAVGQVLTFNTVGAILGAAVTGFGLIYAFGIERSLQILVTVNVGIGLWVLAEALAPRLLARAAPVAAGLLLLALAVSPQWGRLWDEKYFAIFRNNQRSAFDSEFRVRDALLHTDVLYYHEGVNETISVIRPKGGRQAFIVNGRPEATTSSMDVQCQRTLGHLPMLLHPNPKRVFVLGTGTGMTLGAVTIHPEVERILLAEIEPGVLPAARTFGPWNHDALDSPKVRVVFNDGRNYLTTTRETFDVITADPIHPWSGGAAYLYTAEYFRTVAARLEPGGIACQWLPIYELTVRDVQTVLRTFAEQFRHVLIWLTHFDAEIVGSNAPIVIDEASLERRMARAELRADLEVVDMGSVEDFLSYFIAGDAAARAYARGGVLNTDDNLFLEFSAPESMGIGRLMGDNVSALARHRESIVPYLARPGSEADRVSQDSRWARNLEAGRLYDQLHTMFLWNQTATERFAEMRESLDRLHPTYAPMRFLAREIAAGEAETPRLVDAARFEVLAPGGARRVLEISAVAMRIGDTRAAVVFVDNERRDLYGQRYLDGQGADLDREVAGFAGRVLTRLRREYTEASARAAARGLDLPTEAELAAALRSRVAAAVDESPPSDSDSP